MTHKDDTFALNIQELKDKLLGLHKRIDLLRGYL